MPKLPHSGDSNDDLHLLVLKTNGGYVSHGFYGASNNMDLGIDISIGENGAIYLTGKSDGPWLGPDGESPRYQHAGTLADIFLIKFTKQYFPWPMMLPAIIGNKAQ